MAVPTAAQIDKNRSYPRKMAVSVADIAAELDTRATSVGYATGAGGAVTQLTNKSTTVVLAKPSGRITMHAASLGATTAVTFTVTNTTVGVNDMVLVRHSGIGTLGQYTVTAAVALAGGAFDVTVTNTTGGALAVAVEISFVVIKGSAA